MAAFGVKIGVSFKAGSDVQNLPMATVAPEESGQQRSAVRLPGPRPSPLLPSLPSLRGTALGTVMSVTLLRKKEFVNLYIYS